MVKTGCVVAWMTSPDGAGDPWFRFFPESSHLRGDRFMATNAVVFTLEEG